MAIPVTEDGRAIQSSVRDFLGGSGARAEQRRYLDEHDSRESGGQFEAPHFWAKLASQGWLGVNVPERFGGGGGNLGDLVAVLEEVGRAVAPGNFLASTACAAIIDRAADEDLRTRWLPGLAAGTILGACGTGDALRTDGTSVSGEVTCLVGASDAAVLLLTCGDDLLVIQGDAPGLSAHTADGIDAGYPLASIRFDRTPAHIIPGGATDALAVLRTTVAAEAVGGAQQCLDDAVSYAKVREQFGRPIGSFQAVKHHCANMLAEAELATAAVWDATRAATAGGEEFSLAAAAAASLAIDAFLHNAKLNIQVHGGIGYTWEHDAHLLLRRAVSLAGVVRPSVASSEVAILAARGVSRSSHIELPADVEAQRPSIRHLVEQVAAVPEEDRAVEVSRARLAMPHWPEPWGMSASPGLQVVIEQELARAGVETARLGITGWVILTLIQCGTQEQVERWVSRALAHKDVWCQLSSEPGAGSDAAAVSTRGVRVDGGWLVRGQKIWTSGAQRAAWGLATVRTNLDAAKHTGITAMVIDMSAPGVEVRPIKQITGASDFNEVFFEDVFVPDSDVVGEVGNGWAVARATFGNERVSIGSGQSGEPPVDQQVCDAFADAGSPREHLIRVGAFLARSHAGRQLMLRQAVRAVAGGAPGPEGNLTKLLRAERLQGAADLRLELLGPVVAARATDTGVEIAHQLLDWRRGSIAGGTSEITRNQIAERILGLPRETGLR